MEIGDRYEAVSTALIRNNRTINVGSTWAVNFTLGDLVSMSLLSGGVPGGADKLTINKSVFGENFKPSPGPTLSASAYRISKHWYKEKLNPSCMLYPR